MDNECLIWLSNLSKGPPELSDLRPTWLDFEIYQRKARLFPQSQGIMIWSQSWHTWPDSEPWRCSLTHWAYPDLSPRSLSLRRGYKLHVTSHSKDIEQNGGLEEGTDRGKCKMKGGTRMPQWFYCGFFSRPNVPHCKRKSTMPSCACLIMRVSKQANNYHPVQTDQLAHSHAKKHLPRHFYYQERLCLVYLFTLYTPGP